MTDMKNFIIQIAKRTQDPSNSYKNYLLDKVFKKYPYLEDNCTYAHRYRETYKSPADSLEKAVNNDCVSFVTFENGLELCRKPSLYDVNFNAKAYLDGKYKKSSNDVRLYDLYTEFAAAMEKIDEYARYRRSTYEGRNSSADFYIGDAAVKVHSSYIQINEEIIPKSAGLFLLMKLSPVIRVELYKVVVTVNKFYLL